MPKKIKANAPSEKRESKISPEAKRSDNQEPTRARPSHNTREKGDRKEVTVGIQLAHYAISQAIKYLTAPLLVLLALHFLKPHIPLHIRLSIDSVRFPSIYASVQIPSVGTATSDTFATSHQDLARVIAYTNDVHSAPWSLVRHRTQMYEILQHLPRESYQTHKRIHTFLDQTKGMPYSLQLFIYGIQGIGTLAVREYEITKDLVVTIRNTPPPFCIAQAWKLLARSDYEEEMIRSRLLEHTNITLSAVRKGLESVTEQLFLHNALTATASDLKISAMNDKNRSWKTKADDVLVRIGAQFGRANVPSATTRVNKNLEVTDRVLRWSTDIKEWLNLILTGLQDTEAGLTFLQESLSTQNEINRFGRLEQPGREYVLDEFVGSFDSGVQLLLSSTEAWEHLRRDRYI